MHTARMDLHCHSIASTLSGTWILKQIGCPESYTSPEAVYKIAMDRGMDFVTITDHDVINGAREIAHYDNVIPGLEATALFPDKVKAHVICLDISEQQYKEIDQIRHNIYELVDYLNAEDIIHFVAHPMYKVSGNLTWEHFEKLILLFKRHEAINGGRYNRTNDVTRQILSSLTPEYIDYLANKHNIDPIGRKPWEKFLVGGSDDHGGLYIGSCHTEIRVREMTKEGLLEGIREGRTDAKGKTDGSLTLAHQMVSIAYQHLSSKSGKSLKMLDMVLARQDKKGIITRYKIKRALNKRPKGDGFSVMDEIRAVVKENPEIADLLLGEKMSDEEFNDKVFALASGLLDRFVLQISKRPFLFSSFMTWGTAILSAYIISMSAVRKDADLLVQAEKAMGIKKPEKVVWFTDRYRGTDGVVMTVKKFLAASAEYGQDLTVTIADDDTEDHPEGIKAFPAIAKFGIPMYKHFALHVPSLLEVARWVEREDFSSVVISTPGPVGFAGLIAAKVFGLPVTAIYHTDLPRYAGELTDDFRFAKAATHLTKIFYDQADRILVPSGDYAAELIEWGIKPDKIGFLRRWVDRKLFSPAKRSNNGFFGHEDGVKLLYVGRISKEKNIDLLLKAHSELSKRLDNFTIYCIGDGPYLKQLRQKTAGLDKIHFPGPMYNEKLATAYASADAFIFPSLTDTFGNVVLEAQASGLPCVVMDKGGPKEIIVENESGIVARSEADFIMAMERLITNSELRNYMSQEAISNSRRFDKEEIFTGFWNDVLRQEATESPEIDFEEIASSLSYM